MVLPPSGAAKLARAFELDRALQGELDVLVPRLPAGLRPAFVGQLLLFLDVVARPSQAVGAAMGELTQTHQLRFARPGAGRGAGG